MHLHAAKALRFSEIRGDTGQLGTDCRQLILLNQQPGRRPLNFGAVVDRVLTAFAAPRRAETGLRLLELSVGLGGARSGVDEGPPQIGDGTGIPGLHRLVDLPRITPGLADQCGDADVRQGGITGHSTDRSASALRSSESTNSDAVVCALSPRTPSRLW